MARFARLSSLCGLAALAPAVKLATDRYNDPFAVIKDVEYAKGLVRCPKGVRNDVYHICEAKSLLLDVYPAHVTATERGPLFPAILLVHGSGNAGGSKEKLVEVSRANAYSRRGFVVFVPNYRLFHEKGVFPGTDFKLERAQWRSLYPAVRDVKAAARFIRANARAYGVDVRRVVASGTSAGGMDVLAAFTSAKDAFTAEVSLADDPTLSTTHLETPPMVAALFVHSGNPWGIQAYEQFLDEQPESAVFSASLSPGQQKAMPFVNSPPPLIQFHGSDDNFINVSNARDMQDMYKGKGATTELHVMQGKNHADWTVGCNASDYCPEIDNAAIRFFDRVFKAAA